MRFVESVTLEGRHATLEPLARGHEAALAAAAADGELWRLWYTGVPAPGATAAWIEAALAMRENFGAMPFVVRDRASGSSVAWRPTSVTGSTKRIPSRMRLSARCAP